MTARTLASTFLLALVALLLGAAAHATTPGANGRIVFQSSRQSGSTQLYSANADGSDVVPLTHTSDTEQEAVWSPDGTRIAWVKLVSGSSNGSLWVMNADGSDQHQVSPANGFAVIVSRPTWSPDGTQLAFAGWRSTDAAWTIWVCNADGTNLHPLSAGTYPVDPAWSPDGSQIAFASSDAISVVHADGTGGQRLTTPPAGLTDGQPDWSPDGTSLAFERRSINTNATDIYRVSADGSGLTQLTSNGSSFGPSYSPDGSKLAFYTLTPTGDSQLFVMSADGSNPTQIDQAGQHDLRPDWGTSTVSPVVPDAPTITILSPTPGQVMLPGAKVPAYYTCQSAVSYIASCTGTTPLLQLLDTATAGDKALTVTATDFDGRTSTATVHYTVVDVLPPTATITTPADGAVYDVGSSVTIDYSCADDPAGLGIASCDGTLPNGSQLPTMLVGSYTFTVVAVDKANHFAVTTVHYKVVDRTPPTVIVTTPSDGDVYYLGATITPDYQCADEPGGSGLATCQATPIDTSTVGQKQFRVTATDNAGNTTTVSRSYSVIYRFNGFFSPTATYPTATSADPGQAVSVRFTLTGNQGPAVLAGSPTWTACDGSSPAPASGSLTYQTTQDRYTYQASTSKSWAGSCRDLVVTLNDGTTHNARFQFGK